MCRAAASSAAEFIYFKNFYFLCRAAASSAAEFIYFKNFYFLKKLHPFCGFYALFFNLLISNILPYKNIYPVFVFI